MTDNLSHAGVKGMKWGVRKTKSVAKKDAKEYTKAKMAFGEGAGVRRRHINNTVRDRSKDAAYKKAFDNAVSNTNMSKRSSQAKVNRKVRNAKNSTKRTARGITHILKGNVMYASTASIALLAGARATGVDKIIANKSKAVLKDAYNSPAARKIATDFVKFATKR